MQSLLVFTDGSNDNARDAKLQQPQVCWMYGWLRRTAFRRVSGGHQEVGLLGARARLLLLAMYGVSSPPATFLASFGPRVRRSGEMWTFPHKERRHTLINCIREFKSQILDQLFDLSKLHRKTQQIGKFCPKSSLQEKNDVLEPKWSRGEQNEIKEIWVRPRKQGKPRQAEASRGRPRQTEGKPRAKPREAEASRGKPRQAEGNRAPKNEIEHPQQESSGQKTEFLWVFDG